MLVNPRSIENMSIRCLSFEIFINEKDSTLPLMCIDEEIVNYTYRLILSHIMRLINKVTYILDVRRRTHPSHELQEQEEQQQHVLQHFLLSNKV